MIEGANADETRPPLTIRIVSCSHHLSHFFHETIVVLVILNELHFHRLHSRGEEKALLSAPLDALLGGEFLLELKYVNEK